MTTALRINRVRTQRLRFSEGPRPPRIPQRLRFHASHPDSNTHRALAVLFPACSPTLLPLPLSGPRMTSYPQREFPISFPLGGIGAPGVIKTPALHFPFCRHNLPISAANTRTPCLFPFENPSTFLLPSPPCPPSCLDKNTW